MEGYSEASRSTQRPLFLMATLQEERVWRGIKQKPSCPVCHHEIDVLRKCPDAKNVRMFSIPQDRWTQFFSANPLDWIQTILRKSGGSKETGTPWATFFGILVWRLRKNKNLFVYQGLSWNFMEVSKSGGTDLHNTWPKFD